MVVQDLKQAALSLSSTRSARPSALAMVVFQTATQGCKSASCSALASHCQQSCQSPKAPWADFSRGHRRFRQAIQFGIGFDAIAHALDQQAQTMTVMGRIVQGLIEFLPLLGQAFFDALDASP